MLYKTIILFLFMAMMESCCLVTSQDCSCNPPDPFISAESQNWIKPIDTTEFTLNSELNSLVKITIMKLNYSGTEFIGGDECGSNFMALYSKYTMNLDPNPFLKIISVRDEIIFMGNDKYNESYIATLNTRFDTLHQNKFSQVIKSDTIFFGIKHTKLKIKNNTSLYKAIIFKELDFIQNIGIVRIVDSLDNIWIR